ncbi:glycolate oxidase [Tamaricihabitans halophyticus]|uniref:Glycolate oxidase n=1 Tax=Tamaricihabitans halophyticus TaxID=1262583 RepID=A0A4V2STS3_9PSEU|nr:FAD-linked oxidase C-terminal domain-containing protein [Tamaricihabitans halophyticus]TCP51886.1 glycolate oxidase [Tamaricihabitans halophyticus]
MANLDGFSDTLSGIVGTGQLLVGTDIPVEYARDEALEVQAQQPGWLVRPDDTEQVAAVIRAANEHGVPVTARGSGSGLSAGARPEPGGLVLSFERMNAILELDTENHVAVVQPGVTLGELEERTAEVGLVYPVYPGELGGSLGGNVNTNAGGMRAVRYGVTRQHVLGLQAVLGTGEVIRSGGKPVKVSSGYDLTQLIIGSEGTLAVVTEATVKLQPRLTRNATVLAPFADLDQVMHAVPRLLSSGVAPHILEYIDALTMGAITYTAELTLGIPDTVRDAAQAYLVVGLENREEDRLQGDIELVGELLGTLGAIEVYVPDGTNAHKLIEAREKAFWSAKAAGAHDIVDIVVPRAALPEFLAKARELAAAGGSGVVGCGHAGDGNVHLAVFQQDPRLRSALLRDMFAVAMTLGGAISGEHGLGTTKTPYFLELEDPTKIALMSRIKQAFDPRNILNPSVILGSPESDPR